APAAPPPTMPAARSPLLALSWLLTATPPVTPPTVAPITAPATAHVPQRRSWIVLHPLRARATASPRPSVFQSRMRPPRVGRVGRKGGLALTESEKLVNKPRRVGKRSWPKAVTQER